MGLRNNGRKDPGSLAPKDIIEQDKPNRGRCCCCRLPGWLMAGFMVLYLLSIAGMSGTAVVLGRQSNFGAFSTYHVEPGFYLKAGWLDYTTSELQGMHMSLKDINFTAWLLGVISAGLLCLSVILALSHVIVLLRGRGGCGLACFAAPMGLTLGGTLLGYYIVAAVYVVKYTNKHLMWPDYAWCMAMGAALLWLFTSFCACGLPSQRHKEYAKHESEAQIEMYPYSQASSFARGKSGGVGNGGMVDVELGRIKAVPAAPKPPKGAKKGWTLFGKKAAQPVEDLPDYRTRADQIAARYRANDEVNAPRLLQAVDYEFHR